jgi:hypothetical protein
MRVTLLSAIASVLVSLAGCATTSSTAPTGTGDPVESTSGGATKSECQTNDDCKGKPARPNVQHCVLGASAQPQCRANACVMACAAIACTADSDCPSPSTCKDGGCAPPAH